MNRALRIIMILSAVAIAGWLAWSGLSRQYLQPRAQLLEQINASRIELARHRTGREEAPKTAAAIKSVVDRTFGPDVETVDHKLRSRLTRLAEHAGLQEQSRTVVTGASTRRQSPARNVFSRGASERALREETDFIELIGSISGEGTFDQALQLIAAIEAEPWVKRIDELKLDPKDNGERLDISVQLTTLFLPGRAPDPNAAITPRAAAPQKWASFAGTNPFRIPAPPEAPPELPPAAQAAPPEPGFPYEQWSLTGVASSPAGDEAWLLNTQTRESRPMSPGQSIQDLTLTAVLADRAEFTMGTQRFVVNVGENLRDRHMVGQ